MTAQAKQNIKKYGLGLAVVSITTILICLAVTVLANTMSEPDLSDLPLMNFGMEPTPEVVEAADETIKKAIFLLECMVGNIRV